MPFPNRESLPEAVKKIPSFAQDIWMKAFNSASEAGEAEDVCFKIAWAAIEKAGFKKNDSGEWIKASESIQLHTKAINLKCAEGTTGFVWEVCIIKSGIALDCVLWPEEVLKASLDKFEGCKVFALSEAQHSAGHMYGKPPMEIVGWIDNVAFLVDGLYGKLHILQSQRGIELKDILMSSFKDNPSLLGLSVDILGESYPNGTCMECTAIHKVTVDVVYDPVAGGQFVRMAAAASAQLGGGNSMDLEKLLGLLKEKKPHIYAAQKQKIEEKKVTMEDLIEWMKDGEKSPNLELEEVRRLTCAFKLETYLKEANLPVAINDKMRILYKDKIFADAELKASISLEKETLDKLLKDTVSGCGDVRITEDDFVKRSQMITDFFDGKVQSFRAAYINLTGDELITGYIKNMKRFTASMTSTTLSNMLGDSITRKMLAEYNQSAYTKDWKKICTPVPVSDFRTNRRDRMGGYGNLPIVSQSGAYSALTSPSDEEATYAVSKKGGTEDITMEMIKNDDVGAVRRIPTKLSQAAARTLYEFVFDFLKDNGNIFDGTALFTTAHGNLATAALDTTSLHARRRAMLKQTELSSGKRLGIPPKFLIVPVDLDKTAYDLISVARNSDFSPTSPDYTRTLQMELIVVAPWTDANNWYLAASPNDIPGLEIGFLDGKQDPELYLQDDPTAGTVFLHDKMTFKIRHIYGGAITDSRAFDGSIVA